jgi:hypothetical protein
LSTNKLTFLFNIPFKTKTKTFTKQISLNKTYNPNKKRKNFMRDPREEDIRTMFAEEGLMYGNKDSEKTFPFDVRARFQYVVYSEKLGTTEDGTVFAKKTSKRYSFFTPEVWEGLVNEPRDSTRKNYFERKQLRYTILHDPYLQARIEGKELNSKAAKKTGLSLEERLAKAKSAQDFGEKVEIAKSDLIEADEIEIVTDADAINFVNNQGVEEQEKTARRRGRPAERR